MTSDRAAGAGLPGTDIGQLKRQAKAWLRRGRAGDAEALRLLAAYHPRGPELAAGDPAALKLADAQLALARWYGFASWPRLHERIKQSDPWKRTPHRARPSADPAGELLRLGCLTYGADDLVRQERAVSMLAADPDLAVATIHTAAATGAVDAVRRMVAADPGLVDTEGGPYRWVPLLYVCFSRIPDDPPARSSLDTAEVLLAAGADPNAGYLWEGLAPPFTALTGAFGGGEDGPNQPAHAHAVELAELLLRAGADANDGQALYNRMFTDSDDQLRVLFAHGLGRGDGGPWRRRLGDAQQSPDVMLADQLIWAVDSGRAPRVELLLRHGVDPNHPGSGHPTHRGLTALELAIRTGSTDLVAMLTAAGAAPPSLSLDDVDQLLASALAGDRRALADAGPELLHRTIARHPDAVDRAVELRRPAAVRLLVEAGFDVNAVSCANGATPLHQAAFAGDMAMATLLVDLGADLTRQDPTFHSTPQGWAEHSHHRELAAYLARAGPHQ